jgi:hypothetical protein
LPAYWKGSKRADRPVQQPAKFEFVIDMTTATAPGISIPPSIPPRAGGVIEWVLAHAAAKRLIRTVA